MSSITAIHVRSGDRAGVRLVDEWLARHHVAATSCDDVLDAAVLMLTRPEVAPDLAIVGLAYLDPQERTILQYLRQTWPHLAIVAYGPGELAAPAAGRLHCPTLADLHEALARGPEALCRALSSESGAAPPGRPAAPPGRPVAPPGRPAAPPDRPAAPPAGDHDHEGAADGGDPPAPPVRGDVVAAPAAAVVISPRPAESLADDLVRRDTKRAASGFSAPRAAGLRSIALERPMLTAAELADLLDGPLS